MFDFIALPKETLAHSEETVLEEIRKFIIITKKKKNEDEAQWLYHRI